MNTSDSYPVQLRVEYPEGEQEPGLGAGAPGPGDTDSDRREPADRARRSQPVPHLRGLGPRRRLECRDRGGRSRRGAGDRHRAHDPVPAEVSALVVQLESGAGAIQRADRCLSAPAAGRLSLDRRAAGGDAGDRLSRCFRRAQPGTATVQVAAGDTPLHRPERAGSGGAAGVDPRLDRDSRSPAASRAGSSSSWRAICAGGCASRPTPTS